MNKQTIACIAGLVAALVSLPVLADSGWVEGYAVDTSYDAAYEAARDDAALTCLAASGTPGAATNVLHSASLGGGYVEVLVERICFGI